MVIVDAPAGRNPRSTARSSVRQLRRPVAEVIGDAVVGPADHRGHARALEHHALARERRVAHARVAVRHGMQITGARRQPAHRRCRERDRPGPGGRRAHVVVDDRGSGALAAQIEASDAAVRGAADLERHARRLGVDEHGRIGRRFADRRGGHGRPRRGRHGEDGGECEAEGGSQAGHSRMIAHPRRAPCLLTRSEQVPYRPVTRAERNSDAAPGAPARCRAPGARGRSPRSAPARRPGRPCP